MSDIDENRIRALDGALLLVLRELLRQRRTTLAADRLGMSQSAVSHALARLRTIFDDPLFTRRPHGLDPTRHALDLEPKVERLLAAMADAIGIDDEFTPSRTTRDFSIGAPDHVSTLLAPSLIGAAIESAPNARVAFSQHLGDDALGAVRRGDIDLALGRFRARVGGDLVVRPLYEDRYRLVARPDHPGIGRRLTPTRYRSLDHVQISVTGDLRTPEIARFAPSAPARRTIASVPRFEMAFGIVASSDAVALAPGRLARAAEATLGLIAHDLPFDTEPIRVVAVHRDHTDHGVRWLIETMEGLEAVRGS
jgi:DNA-binding transcriptional LysR family regulator